MRWIGVFVVALVALTMTAAPAAAIPGPECRLSGDATITTGDSASARGRTIDFQANLGNGHIRHMTSTGERFDGRVEIFGCHANTGDLVHVEGTGSFRGSTTVLTMYVDIADRDRLSEPDYYSIAIFAGTTLVYNTFGDVVAGGFTVTITP